MDGTKWSTSLTWPCTSALLPIQLTSCGWHQAPPLTGAKEQSPISPRISPPQFKFKEIQIFFLTQIHILIVMACANFGCNLMNRKWFAAKWNSHQIWIMSEKSLMNWAPGHHLFQKATNRESVAITATPHLPCRFIMIPHDSSEWLVPYLAIDVNQWWLTMKWKLWNLIKSQRYSSKSYVQQLLMQPVIRWWGSVHVMAFLFNEYSFIDVF